ncbi:MAG: nucleotidyltransferase family protein [Lachnospiraceae bacterium]|nr:nucleotidyltransferase family protein [Lachnospiraceae bacterium]
MNVIGIIAEYNPFHRGHEYQIQQLKEICDADYAIIAMSGNFVQRGAPALMDKYSRARMALCCGADLVLELPALFATASAEYFARGGVCLLNSTGVATHLGFGTEAADARLLSELAGILHEEPKPYREFLHAALKSGSSFPAARSAALQQYISASQPDSPRQHSACSDTANLQPSALPLIAETLASPNNILALEYLQALADSHSTLVPIPLLRKGRGYHDSAMATDADFCSASAIRSCLKNGGSPLPVTAMPKASYDILTNYPHPFLFEDDFSALLHYELITENAGQLASWADSSDWLARRLLAERGQLTDWSSFCRQIKTKNITYSRISRLFSHILLHIRHEDYEVFTEPAYLRVLGFRKAAAPLLTALKSNSCLPFVTSPADASRYLSPESKRLLSFDLRATDLYRLGLAAKGDSSLKNDFKQQIIRI